MTRIIRELLKNTRNERSSLKLFRNIQGLPLTMVEHKSHLLCCPTEVLLRLFQCRPDLSSCNFLFSWFSGRSCLDSLDLCKISKYLSKFQTHSQDLALGRSVWNWAPFLLVLCFQNWQSKYWGLMFHSVWLVPPVLAAALSLGGCHQLSSRLDPLFFYLYSFTARVKTESFNYMFGFTALSFQLLLK